VSHHPFTTRTARRGLAAGLLLALAGVAVFVLAPTADLPSAAVHDTSEFLTGRGAPAWLASRRFWEITYNIALFAPVTAFAALLWHWVPLWGWGALGLVVSLAIEAVQALFLSGRSPHLHDLVANTTGALVGALVARWVWRALREEESQLRTSC
jgi:hypothetical protein